MSLIIVAKKEEPLVIEHGGERLLIQIQPHETCSRLKIDAPQSFRVVRLEKLMDEESNNVSEEQ